MNWFDQYGRTADRTIAMIARTNIPYSQLLIFISAMFATLKAEAKRSGDLR